MKKPIILLSLIAALAGGTAFAQDAEQPELPSPPEGTLDLGEPVAGADPRAPYVKEVHTDWTVRCLEVSEGNEICQMYQLLKDENGASVAEVNIFRLQGGGQAVAGGAFTVPLETLLTQKLTIAIDGREAKRYDYTFCTVQGCIARIGFTAEDITRLKAGNEAVVTLVPVVAPDQRVSVSMSLSGFTAAYEQTSELQP
ncbi:invasion associated locus B family protein [Antarctobacter jejuensis]|uniref:invasion associated locus B family protein n=1 Tax=Antarctobacter jejuensis TaxID=1439938 RepID=UPI003FD63A61